jgi:hypothetical protein
MLPEMKKQEVLDANSRYDSLYAYMMYNYIRKFTLYRILLGDSEGIFLRTPFLSNKFMHYVRSIPTGLKEGRNIYMQMLRRHFPEYYADESSVPGKRSSKLNNPKKYMYYVRTTRKLIRQLLRNKSKTMMSTKRNYKALLINEASVAFYNDTILSQNAYCTQYVP